jgi:hypothetical protein
VWGFIASCRYAATAVIFEKVARDLFEGKLQGSLVDFHFTKAGLQRDTSDAFGLARLSLTQLILQRRFRL